MFTQRAIKMLDPDSPLPPSVQITRLSAPTLFANLTHFRSTDIFQTRFPRLA